MPSHHYFRRYMYIIRVFRTFGLPVPISLPSVSPSIVQRPRTPFKFIKRENRLWFCSRSIGSIRTRYNVDNNCTGGGGSRTSDPGLGRPETRHGRRVAAASATAEFSGLVVRGRRLRVWGWPWPGGWINSEAACLVYAAAACVNPCARVCAGIFIHAAFTCGI